MKTAMRSLPEPHRGIASAVILGYPYVAAAHLRQRRTLPDDPFVWPGETSPGAPLNRLGRQRRLSDPNYRVGVGVNADTLYTSAWLDLAHGPLLLELPPIPDRYYSVQFALADTSSDMSLGSRTHGEHMPPVIIMDPQQDAPADMPDVHGLTNAVVIHSETRYLNMPGRILIDPADPADIAAVHRIQDAWRLRTLSDALSGVDREAPVPRQRPLCPIGTEQSPLRFFHELHSVIVSGTLTSTDRRILTELAITGIDPEHGVDLERYAADQDLLIAGLEAGMASIAEARLDLGLVHEGWTVNLRGPRFGDDLLLRAAVAHDQIFVTVPEEGLYPVAHSTAHGDPLLGEQPVTITFASGELPPADAFWSLTAYDSEGFLVPNALDRYTIGDRTPDLVQGSDGSLTITISTTAPDDIANWLPAPAGPYYLMLRMFQPRESALTGAWLPPGLMRLA